MLSLKTTKGRRAGSRRQGSRARATRSERASHPPVTTAAANPRRIKMAALSAAAEKAIETGGARLTRSSDADRGSAAQRPEFDFQALCKALASGDSSRLPAGCLLTAAMAWGSACTMMMTPERLASAYPKLRAIGQVQPAPERRAPAAWPSGPAPPSTPPRLDARPRGVKPARRGCCGARAGPG